MARVARLTLGYYTLCTAAAVALGIVLVTVIEPGQGSPLSGGSVTSCHTPDLKVRCNAAGEPFCSGSAAGLHDMYMRSVCVSWQSCLQGGTLPGLHAVQHMCTNLVETAQ